MAQRKFKDGQTVTATRLKTRMSVITGWETLGKGWMYQLAFINKDGFTVNKQRNHLVFSEADIAE